MNARLLIGFSLVGLAGCGIGSAQRNEARGHVQKALEVWQKGGKPDELKSLSPPVEFHEAMWNAGDVLVRFELGEVSSVESAGVVRCEARLTVLNRKGKAKGKERTETIFYDVTLGPPVKVVNNPMP
jgi:hypothetical protein